MSNPTLADRCETLLRQFLDCPNDGYTLEEIQERCKWSHREATEIILKLGGRVGHSVSRVKGEKVTRYFLKRKA